MFRFLFPAALTILVSLPLQGNDLDHEILSEILKGYQEIRLALANDKFGLTQSLAKNLVPLLTHWLEENNNHPQYANISKMKVGAVELTKAEEDFPKELRARFGILSEGLVLFLKKAPNLQPEWQLFYCPMVTTYAYWVQPKGEKLFNPYMGLNMPNCGSKKPW